MDLIIEARAFVQGALADVEIGIDETTGLIEAVKRNLPGTPRKRYRGQLLIPSGVDWHVHFRDPGHPGKEDFRSGTQAAALGGVGTVLDMPNTDPVVDRPSRLAEKMERVEGKACVDWGLWATITKDTKHAEKLLQDACGLKVYLVPTTGVTAGFDETTVRGALQAAHQAQRWVTVHAEQAPRKSTLRSNRDHDDARPAEAEAGAIEQLARLAPDPAHIHIAHATTTLALDAARRAGFQAAATPHHLLLDYEAAPDAWGKVNPPLRSPGRRKELLAALASGRIPHLESDHAPHTMDEKKKGYADAPAGLPGVQTLLPLLLRLAKAGDVPLEHVVAAACERPARDLGIPTGRIEAGRSADFFLVDPRNPQPVRADRLASKCGWSPFEGRPALFPTTHYLHGRVVVEKDRFVGKPGQGRRIQPGPWTTATSGPLSAHHKP